MLSTLLLTLTLAQAHPSLEGIWTNATLTPMQRPAELAGKEFFTPAEAAEYEKRLTAVTTADAAPKQGDVGAYNAAFFDRGSRIVKTRRTSLVMEPADGRIPAFTPAAQAKYTAFRQQFALTGFNGPEDRDLSERCLMFSGIGPPMLPEPYNNNYQIVESPGYISILSEMNHDARVIPTNGRAHLPSAVPQWHGDSVGRWEGNTFVVDTTNVRVTKHSHFGVGYSGGMADENFRVTERFTRTAPDTIMYRATVTDPTVYSAPWTMEYSMSKIVGPLFEYACHEGNYGMVGILEGARAQEKKK